MPTGMVRALVRHGCNVRIYNWRSLRAREVAQEAGHREIAEFLESCEHRGSSKVLKPLEIDFAEDAKPLGEFRNDWTCAACGASVFARKKHCFKCQAPKPTRMDEEEVDGVSPMAKQLLRDLTQVQ